MKVPKITDDRKWANVGWPELTWLNEKKKNIKTVAKSKGLGAFKKLYNSTWVKDELKKKIYIAQKTEKLAHDTYRITTDYVFQSFLFIGKKQALLVDTGIGFGNLKEVVEELTDKPLIVVCTHAHFGCTGGAGQFNEVKISKADKEYARVYNKICRLLIPLTGKAGKDIDKKPIFVSLTKDEIKDGFDLGGRTIKVVPTPSHTKGSICFLDTHNKIAVVGDVIAPLGFQLLPSARPLNEYISTLDELIPSLEDMKIYCSYFPKPFDCEYARDVKATYYLGNVHGNDFSIKSPIRFRKSENNKLILLSYSSKANKREFKDRVDAYRRGDTRL